MCVNEAVCTARMKRVNDIGEDVSELKKDISEVKKELAVSIAYQKEQGEDLKELAQSLKEYQAKMEKKEEESKKMHPVLIGILVSVGTMLLGAIVLKLLEITF